MGDFSTTTAKPREDPGQLFYPDEHSHVTEKYWDYLPCLDQHPDFKNESQYGQHYTTLLSQALSGISYQAASELRPATEAKQINIEISEDAVISRLRPIQTGLDHLRGHRSSASTDSGGSAPEYRPAMFEPTQEELYNEDSIRHISPMVSAR
jgi:hypothetical protein